MAGFEVVVRPVIFPNIRPAPARALAPEDEPDKGIAVLAGGSGRIIDTSLSESASWTRSMLVETERRFDVVRTYPKDTPEEERDEDTPHIDTERVNRMKFDDPLWPVGRLRFSNAKIGENEELLEKNTVRQNTGGGGGSSFGVGGE